MTSDTIDNRRPTWMLPEVVVGENSTKTNSKKQNIGILRMTGEVPVRLK